MNAPFTPSPRQNVVIAGQLSDPAFASAARGFMDAMCEGAAPTMSQYEKAMGFPKRTGDWDRDLAASFAHINAAFARGVK